MGQTMLSKDWLLCCTVGWIIIDNAWTFELILWLSSTKAPWIKTDEFIISDIHRTLKIHYLSGVLGW